MISTTNDHMAGYHITDYHGVVSGNAAYSRSFDKSLKAELKQSLKSVVGGELALYSEMKKQYFEIAMQRLEEDATQKGANAVIGIQVSEMGSQLGDSVMVIGTAVTVEVDA